MAVTAYNLYYFLNGQKVKDSSGMEPLFKSISVTSDGTSNGYDITQGSGAFSFNSKKLGGVTGGTASGQVLVYDQIGAASGICGLDVNSKVPSANLPNSIMMYQGVWNATTNSPTLADGSGNAGEDIGNVYRVGTAGTQNLGSGSQTFSIGDYVILNASKVWERADTADISTTDDLNEGSVNKYFSGKTTDDLTEGTTNLYWSSSLADTWLGTKTTDALTEGTANLYFSNKTTDNLTEGTANLYFSGKTTDGLSEGTTNLYFSGKTTDDLTEGTVNLYWSSSLADTWLGTKTTDALTEGTSNLYFSNKTTDDLPEGSVNKYAGSTTFIPLVNKEVGAITVGKFVKMTTAGQVTLLAAGDAGLNDDAFIGCVKDASIAADGTGNIYLPEVGARVAGYTGLDVTKQLYVTTAGGYTQTRPTSGKVALMGRPISASEIVFIGRYLYEIV